MSIPMPFDPHPSRRVRGLQALGALASSALTLGALVVMFHNALPAHWRADDAVLQTASEACQQAGAADERLRCMDQVLARHASADVGLAQAEAR